MKKILAFLAVALLAMPLAASAWTPDGDVTVIVAYKAGSGTDTGARLLASQAEKYVGKTLIINNLPGGDGKIGWTELVNAKPDGRTIGFINLPTFTTLAVQPGSTFAVSDVVPVCNQLSETGVVVVRADSPWKSLKELVDACKAKGNLRCSTNGVEASNHTAAQLLATSAGFNYKAIPYGGTADQLLALRQGEVHFSCAKVADVAALCSGDKPELRILGVFNTARLPEYPDVPTLGELGYYKEWYGSARALVLPKGTPQEIVDFYVEAFRKTMQDPACIEAHNKAGMTLTSRTTSSWPSSSPRRRSSAATWSPSCTRSNFRHVQAGKGDLSRRFDSGGPHETIRYRRDGTGVCLHALFSVHDPGAAAGRADLSPLPHHRPAGPQHLLSGPLPVAAAPPDGHPQ